MNADPINAALPATDDVLVLNPSGERTPPTSEVASPLSEENKLISALLMRKWSALSDDEVNHFHTQPEHFYSKVEQKYGLNREQVDAEIANTIDEPLPVPNNGHSI